MIVQSLFWILITIMIYVLMKKFHDKIPMIITIPLITATFIVVLLLHVNNIPYEQYMKGGELFSWILGPAVIAYAVPLYKNRHIVKKYAIPIFLGLLSGMVVAIVSDYILAVILGAKQSIILTTLSKSITLPVSLAIANSNGWDASLTSLWTVIAGLTGLIMGPIFLKISNVTNPVSRGIAYGCASHVMGATRAMQEGEIQGAVSSVTMTLTAIMTAICIPFFLHFIL